MSKWHEWILAERGHGAEWATVLRINIADVALAWKAIAEGALANPVSRVRDLGVHGLNCEVDMRLEFGQRSARVRTIWHYAVSTDPPRLVSAYPCL